MVEVVMQPQSAAAVVVINNPTEDSLSSLSSSFLHFNNACPPLHFFEN